MGFLAFIGKLLGLGRRFSGTPEQYLAMVQYMAKKNCPDQFAESIKDDPYYVKRLRNVVPAINYWNMVDCNWPCRAVTFPNPFPAICSDNPVILRHPQKADAFLDDLIFPLAPNKVFFRIKGMREIFAPNIKFYIDMLLLLQAKEYVC